jgi:hypothetical protein
VAAKKKSIPLQNSNISFWIVLGALGVAFVSSAIIILTSPVEQPPRQNHTPKEWAKISIEVKNNPAPGIPKAQNLFNRMTDEEKRLAAIDVIENDMLSKIDSKLNIVSALPPQTVSSDALKYLTSIYGTPANVPADVYRTACMKICNTEQNFRYFYKGSKRNLDRIVYGVIADYYDLGKPPAGISVSAIEDYFTEHNFKRNIPYRP